MQYLIYTSILLFGLVLGFLVSKRFLLQIPDMDEKEHNKWDIIIKSSSAFTALIILIIGLLQYQIDNERKFRSTLYDDRYELYSDLLEVTSKLENLRIDDLHEPNPKCFNQLKKDFLSFYYGKMVLIEDSEVQTAMIELKTVLKEYEFENRKDIQVTHREIKIACLDLAFACRNSLINTTDVRLKELEKH